MRQEVVLYKFFQRLQDRGVDLEGCRLEEGSGCYRFLRMDGNNLQVNYGPDFSLTGHMSAGLKVDSISIIAVKSGRKIVTKGRKNSAIIVTFSSLPRRW